METRRSKRRRKRRIKMIERENKEMSRREK